MKKRNLESLSLNKKVISNFENTINGGLTIDTIKHELCQSKKTKCDNQFINNAMTPNTDEEQCNPQGCK